MEWHPADTLPKDGHVLFFCAGFRQAELGIARPDGTVYCQGGRFEPTDWMPLPENPR